MFHVGALIKIRASARSATVQMISEIGPPAARKAELPRKPQRQERQ